MIGLIILFVFWMSVGIITNASGIAIYASFPSKPFFPASYTFTITIKNNAATKVPFFVPLYLAIIQTSNATCTYFNDGGCNGLMLDEGAIESGGSATLTFYLTPMQQHDFGVAATVYLNLWNNGKISAGSKSLYFTYLTNGTYLMQ